MLKKGFTIVELIVVMIIVGILSYTFFLKWNNWQEPFKLEMMKMFNSFYLSVDNYPFDKNQDFFPKANEKVTNVIVKLDHEGIVDYQYYTYAENKQNLAWTTNTNSKNLINLWDKNKVYYHWEKGWKFTLDSHYHKKIHDTWTQVTELWKTLYFDLLKKTGVSRWVNNIEIAYCIVNQKEHEDGITISRNEIKSGIYILIDRKNFYISKTLQNNYINGASGTNLSWTDIVPIHNLSCSFFINDNNYDVSWNDVQNAIGANKNTALIRMI